MPPMPPGELPVRRELAFMTECLSRAVELCRPTLSAKQAQCFDRILAIAWDWVEGAPVDSDERMQLHKEVERLGIRNAPDRAGRLELFFTANAATFVLGVIVQPQGKTYAGTLRHTVPNVLRSLFPRSYQSPENAELAWQAAATERLATLDNPKRGCFSGL